MNSLRVTVASIDAQGTGNRRICLVPADGSPLPAFDAGAHIDVKLPGGMVRQYSLVNAPWYRDGYEICVRRDAQSRGASAYLHDVLSPGDVLDISGPRNCFALERAARYVLVAGGIGITPLLAMAQNLSAQRIPFALHYYGGSESDTPYLKELRAGFETGTVTLHFSESGDSLRHAMPAELDAPLADSMIYLCGPSGFMECLRGGALERGWSPSQIKSEAFDAQPVVAQHGDAAFEVEIESTGQVFVVPPGETIASVLQAGDVAVSLSCEQGICGACLTGIVSGRADHRDEVLSGDERDAHTQIAICCSRSTTSRIVLAL
ncbi:vanillate O-demethylase ferredoxin subunit [Paraburkholderia fungorum]|uniref:Vanillate O-demethylase ferredoxin subunit n=1 Tax=Paraburkholderia fungorum TaxID=134537 RepID=A0A1H1JKY3_9BURK|nr:PDR/VanB family oxidoreductase [Paraburkholderia fungorum]SDR50379.1 vanillate O-demethylase ferredoxin subunit [Paraburkholderia fungorum]